MPLSEYMQKRQEIKLGIREKDPPKERQPLAKVSEKKKKEQEADKAAGIKPEKKPLKRTSGGRSEKMKGIMAAIKPLYRSFLKEKEACEIRSPVCTGQPQCVHHTAGRGMAHLMDTNTWKAACSACNLYVEENDGWARDNGHKISRHQKG